MPQENKIDTIRKMVKQTCGKDEFNYRHISHVVRIAKDLARKLKADEEVVEAAAWLHDIGRVMFGEENHHESGSEIGGKMIQELGYPEDFVNHVKDCILSHRGSTDIKPKTLEARILANADAMSHFVDFIALVSVALQKHDNDPDKTRQWLREKAERNWSKKLTLPEAREMVKGRYEAIKILITP